MRCRFLLLPQLALFLSRTYLAILTAAASQRSESPPMKTLEFAFRRKARLKTWRKTSLGTLSVVVKTASGLQTEDDAKRAACGQGSPEQPTVLLYSV